MRVTTSLGLLEMTTEASAMRTRRGGLPGPLDANTNACSLLLHRCARGSPDAGACLCHLSQRLRILSIAVVPAFLCAPTALGNPPIAFHYFHSGLELVLVGFSFSQLGSGGANQRDLLVDDMV